ncbi:M14 family zinc carboxypeptidase [Candidatus Uabimicrobium sp. HlEnr_7]|uniref:M14 family zinc carboxypeptidase n=1 Tax=Candidatus Uabimicrobium helgolandensis TaxID=3095367 RepID=UPI003557A060
MRIITIAILIITLVAPIWAQEAPILSRIEIEAPSTEKMMQLATLYEVRGVKGQVLEIIIPNVFISEAEEITGTTAKIIEKDIHKKIAQQRLDEYPSYQQVQQQMKSWEESYPQFVKLEQYGSSTSGLPLLALRVSDNVNKKENEPSVLLTAATHGDELITVRVMLAIMKKVIEGNGATEEITQLVANREIWFIPVVSPDGYTKRQRYVGWTDPNRDFPWPQDPQHKSIPCIQGLRNLFTQHNFSASVDYHASGRMYMYPWAYTKQSPSKAQDFDVIAKGMAKYNDYIYGQISKVIYVAQGSSCDYFHWRHNTTSLAVEVGTSKVPHGAEIDRVVAENIDAAIFFIKTAPK